MKAPTILGICAALSVGLFAQDVQPPAGQPAPSRPEPLRGMMRVRPYDKSKERTITAKVVDAVEFARGPLTVVVLKLDVDGQDVQITVGTKEFLKEKGMAFAKGDEITIRGTINGPEWQIDQEGPRGSMDHPGHRGGEAGKHGKDGKDGKDGKPSKPGKDKKPPAAAEKQKGGGAPAPKEAETAGEARMAPGGKPGEAPPSRALRIRAREVTKGGKTLTLLSDEGSPVWRPGPPPVPPVNRPEREER